MKLNRSMISLAASASLLVLTGCASGGGDPAAEVEPSADSSVATPSAPSDPAASDMQAPAGGQVVEVGAYHLELMPEVEGESTHLDLYLQKGDSHEAVSDAQVTAQVDLPNGTQQSLDMDYDAEGKHYTALVPSSAPGEYKVAVLSDIGGEKVNGRFSFTK